MPRFLYQRGGHWHFCRRVPLEFRALDDRGVVKHSTKIRIADDRYGAKAGRVAERFNTALETFWLGLAKGPAAEAQRFYDQARARAREYGFEYAQAQELAEGPLVEILERVDALLARRGMDDPETIAGVLGGAVAATLPLTSLFDEFEALMRVELADLSPDQLRRWRNPKKRAVANLVGVVGDKPVGQLTRDDALEFRFWWEERVLEDGLAKETANKDFGHLNRMFKTVDRRKRLGLQPVFAELRFEGSSTETPRAAYTVEFLQERILAPDALATLNPDARRVIYLMVETGIRPSEAVALNDKTIDLTANIPHVKIRPDGRRLKTAQSNRDLPLLGVSLQAMREQPNGFPRYHDKAASLSALVNKYLEAHGLRPTEDHSLYSVRHAFKDRLREVDCPDELVDEFMGHLIDKPDYGEGSSLLRKARWLKKITLKAPPKV